MVYFRQYVKRCVKKAGAIGEGVCIPLCQRALFPLRIFRYSLQSGRPDPGNSRSKCFLHMEDGCFIFVALSGPKEAPEAIISLARHEVNMHMGDAILLLYVGCASRKYAPPVQEVEGFLKTDAL